MEMENIYELHFIDKKYSNAQVCIPSQLMNFSKVSKIIIFIYENKFNSGNKDEQSEIGLLYYIYVIDFVQLD